MKPVITIILLYFLLPFLARGQTLVKYPELVEKLYDLEALSIPPHKEEKTATFSSYDRKSKYDSINKTYVSWAANGDGNGYIRMEDNEMVIFEADGPGVIWRVWSALAKEGHIKIYIDHKEVPVLDRPFRAFFENFEDDIPPMNFPNLVMTLSRGRNRYLPIQYQQHCKITLSENWGSYYHIVYSNFPKSTKFKSFNGSYSNEERISLAKADRWLNERGYSRKIYPNEVKENFEITLKPGEKKTFKELFGNNAISHVTVELSDSISQENLNDIWLDFSWDNSSSPAVYSPIGLFFGTGQKMNPYRSLPTGVIGNSLYSNWYMPFRSHAKLMVENKGDQPHQFNLHMIHHPLDKFSGDFLRFHATYYADKPEMQFINKPNIDILIEDFEGENHNAWKVTGEAFGSGPVSRAFPNQNQIDGYLGNGFLNSYHKGDSSKGSMFSPLFKIEKKYINFLIGGGSDLQKTNIALYVNDKKVRTTSGNNTESLNWASWDVSEFLGDKGYIQITDNSSGDWGHINVDHIYLSEENKAKVDGRNIDWTFLNIEGTGRYCGLTLHVKNIWETPYEEPETWWYGKWDKKTIDWWWGEGDEKFFIDGEKFPSTFGTGSEDYIGYAWSAEPPFPTFEIPFACQPQTPINGNGHTIVNRFHIADNVPFQQSFEGVLERYKNQKWGANKENICKYQAVVYYYLK